MADKDKHPVPTAKARTTMRPGTDQELPLDEVTVLRHERLLVSVDGVPEPGHEPPAKPAAKSGAPGAGEKGA